MSFRILKAVKNVCCLWNGIPCGLVNMCQSFGGMCKLKRRFEDSFGLGCLSGKLSCPDGGGSRLFRSAGILLPDYTATDPRMQNFSYFSFVKYQCQSQCVNHTNLRSKAVWIVAVQQHQRLKRRCCVEVPACHQCAVCTWPDTFLGIAAISV
jgi:hypothetical protein